VIEPIAWDDDGTRLQTSVIYSPSMHKKAINETEKPRGILEPLIEYGCKPGGLVFDPFAGSCSTLVAARALGRPAVGIEKREAQCEKAVLCRLSQGVLTFSDVS
jgi:site-specific DNA-methyltransferase (adenine-specific)